MISQTDDTQNRRSIQEFLDRAPSIQIGITVNLKATSPNDAVEFDENFIEDETDVTITDKLAGTRPSGFTITGDVPVDLKEGIDAFYNHMCFDLLGQRMSEETLMQPIRLLSAFLEGKKSFGKIADYDVRFDPNRSSHRIRAVGYSIAITAVSTSWWTNTARQLWDSFVDLILDPNAPSVAVRLSEVLPKWIEALLKIFQNPPLV